VDVEIAPKALKSIRSQGGRLFLWTKDVGQGWETDQLAYVPPPAVQFALHDQEGFQLYIEEGIDVPEQLKISSRFWPLRGVRVTWDGRRSGVRGDWGTREPGATGPG
jgi:hypothetical protein